MSVDFEMFATLIFFLLGGYFVQELQVQGATSIVKIGEVRLSDEIGGEGFETLKKPNFIITIWYEIPTYVFLFCLNIWPITI